MGVLSILIGLVTLFSFASCDSQVYSDSFTSSEIFLATTNDLTAVRIEGHSTLANASPPGLIPRFTRGKVV